MADDELKPNGALRGASGTDPLAAMYGNMSINQRGAEANKALGNLGGWFDNQDKMVTDAIKGQKRLAANSLETMDGFMSSMQMSGKRGAKNTANTIEEMFDTLNKSIKTSLDQSANNMNGIIRNAEGMSKAVEKSLDRALAQAGVKRDSVISNMAKNAMDDIVKSGALNIGNLSKMALEGFAVGSVGVAMDAQSQANGMMKSLGGNFDQINQFMTILPQVSVAARMTTSQVLELGMAFANAGIPLTQNTKDLEGYLDVAGKASQLMGLSATMAAGYTKNLIAQGYTSEQVSKSFGTLYDTMQMTNQSTQDIIEAMGQAANLVSEFGGTAHRNMFEFTNDLIQARGLFKGLGVDAKFAGDMIADSMKDGGMTAMRRAALTANALGGSQAKYFNDQMFDPAQGLKNTTAAAMTQLLRISPDAGLSQAELMKKFGGDQNAVMQSGVQSLRSTNNIAQLFGMNPQELQQMLSNYRGSGATSVGGWMQQREKEQNATKPPIEWTKAWDNVNSTFPKLLEQFTRVGQNLMIIFGSPVIGMLTPLLQAANFFLDKLAMMMTSTNPIVKGLTSVASIGTIMFIAFKPVMGILRGVTGLASAMGPTLNVFKAFSGLAAGMGLGGLVEFLPAILAGTIAVGITALAVAFIPQIIKAIGDGFNAAVNWFKSIDWFNSKGTPVPVSPMPGVPGSGFNPNNGGGNGANGSGGGGGAASPILNGKTTSERALEGMKYFTSQGLSPAQAAGMMGSLMQESGLRTNAVNPTSGAFGIEQVLGGRKTRLAAFAAAQGRPMTDYGTQLAFIMQELKTSEGRAYKQLLQAQTPEQAAYVAGHSFERAGAAEMNDRARAKYSRESLLVFNRQAGNTAMPVDTNNIVDAVTEQHKRAVATTTGPKSDVAAAVDSLHDTIKEQHTETKDQRQDIHTQQTRIHRDTTEKTQQTRIHRDVLAEFQPIVGSFQ